MKPLPLIVIAVLFVTLVTGGYIWHRHELDQVRQETQQSDQERHCSEAKEAFVDFADDAGAAYDEELAADYGPEKFKAERDKLGALLRAARVVANNQPCFSPSDVATAQQFIENYTRG